VVAEAAVAAIADGSVFVVVTESTKMHRLDSPARCFFFASGPPPGSFESRGVIISRLGCRSPVLGANQSCRWRSPATATMQRHEVLRGQNEAGARDSNIESGHPMADLWKWI